MVITCPSCKARYKMPGRKIKGRGAKITCPRCSHVFVIFSKDVEDESESPAAASAPAASAPAASAPAAGEPPSDQAQRSFPARNVTPPGPASISDHDSPAAGSQVPGSLRAEDIFGKGAEAEAAPTSRTRGVRRRHRRPVGGTPTTPPTPPPATQPASDPASPSETAFDLGTPLQAVSLDFKSVGITTWKVKVAIGLVYDFSDVQTLYRYIQEKKITPGDQISFDGKTWSPVGDDEELERFLLQVFSDKKREAAGGEAAPATGTPTPSSSGSATERPTPPPADSESSVSEDTRVSDGDKSAGGYKVDLKQPPRHRKRTKTVESRKIMGLHPPVLYGIGLIALVVVVVIIFVVRGGSPPATTTPLPGATGNSDSSSADKVRDEAREKIDRELKEQQDRIREEEGGGDGLVIDGTGPRVNDGTAQLINGPNTGDSTPSEPSTPDITPTAEAKTPTEERTPAQHDAVVKEQPTPEPPEVTPSKEEDDATAEDWAMLGDMAMASGNCNEAIGHLKLAVGMSPSSSTYNYKLGKAYHQCGQDSAAKGPLKKAASTYPDAQKLLDQIEGN